MVKIYTTPTCHYCAMAKEFFDQNNVKYESIDVLGSPEARGEMVEKSGQMGVPVIEIGNDIVVGFDKEKLSSLLGIAA